MTATAFNPAIVQCLRIAYRRGLAVIAAEREREQKAADVSLVCETGDTSAAVTPGRNAQSIEHDTTNG